jgi:hypothetical protein
MSETSHRDELDECIANVKYTDTSKIIVSTIEIHNRMLASGEKPIRFVEFSELGISYHYSNHENEDCNYIVAVEYERKQP